MLALLIAAAQPVHWPPPPPPAPPPPSALSPDPFAHLIKARAPVTWEGKPANAELLIHGAAAAVQLAAPARAPTPVIFITTPAEALAVLADVRLAPLWPALLDWAGADLVRLREMRIETAARAYNREIAAPPATTTSDSLVTPRTRAFATFAVALAQSGRLEAAMKLIDQRIADAEVTGDAARDRFDEMQLVVRRARLQFETGEAAGAIAALDDATKAYASETEYLLNLDVNKASYLAYAGRYAEALTLIEGAEAKFRATEETPDEYKVGGSGRQFAWIRACALHGLGRRDEAARVFAPILRATREPVDDSAALELNDSIRARGLSCMGDAEGLAGLLFDALSASDAFASTSYVWLQPARVRRGQSEARRTVYARARRDPRLAGLLEGRFRELPPIFSPALNNWPGTR